ncbi:replication protein A 70 kDa DNA-binding subunit B [Artemisia annua]|uniref:Replication protein A 70 kDa DNA-binding subunit B n=1 Tax=Artemisia annua TaxID=35608 RepID=A0A2U1N5G2_ARTAN|nr:replication protein A 70 kDa DNA-binding subunit B [Artemisia annua]
MSKFTGWMRANDIYPEGRTLTYADYPTEFTWHDRDKEWRPHYAKFFTDSFPYISEDITHKQRRLLNNQQVVFTDREIQNYMLLELETILNGNNKSLLDFPQLPQIDYSLMNIGRNRLIAAERMYNMNEEWARFTTFNRYQYVGDLRPNVTNKWTINVMISRAWTTYNPTTNRILSLDLILVDERRSSIHAKLPYKLINKFKDRVKEGCVYKIHNFTVLDYGTIIYRPLDRKFFVEFCFTTTTGPSLIRAELFVRYVFAFVPFGSLTDRYGVKTYLTDVIGVLREWGPVQDNVGKNQGCNPQLRKIVIADMSDVKLNVSLWGKMALMYEDSFINSIKDTNVVVVLTCCKVGPYAGAPQLTTTASTQFHLNLPIVEAIAYNNRPIHPVIFTSPYLKTDELKVTPIPEIYKRLANGADVGTKFIVYGMVIGVDLVNDWKYIQCTKCWKKATLQNNQYYCDVCKKIVTNPRQTYKLVITVQDNNEEMNCVLFNSDAISLIGLTTQELITKSIKEGAGNLDWIVDYFIDSLIARWVVLGIKIESYNLAPTYVRRYTVTKYYGHDVNALNKHGGSSSSSSTRMVYSDVNIPSSVNDFNMADYAVIGDENMDSAINQDEENMMDDLMWGQDCELEHPITHIKDDEGHLAANTSRMDVIMNDPNEYKPIVDVDVVQCEAKDSLHAQVQDVPAHGMGVNTIVSSSCSASDDIKIDVSETQVEDATVQDNQVDEGEVNKIVVSEPQADEADVDDGRVNRF